MTISIGTSSQGVRKLLDRRRDIRSERGPLDPDGDFCIHNQSPVDLIVDEQGFFGPTGGLNFSALGPSRVFDSGDLEVRAPGSITRIVTGAPAGTAEVLVNLTMVAPNVSGASKYITADKCSTLKAGPQTKSSGNHSANPVANLAVVSVDADGSF